MALELYANKIKGPNKVKCGDSFVKEESGDRLLLAVADGVSGCPSDWLASSLACDAVVNAFRAKPDGRLEAFAEKAHSALLNAPGDMPQGMLTSLSLAILETKTRRMKILNVGDSAIFVGTEDSLRVLTDDDATFEPLMMNGELMLVNGVPRMVRAVNRALGQKEPLEFDSAEVEVGTGEVIVFVSDGVTGSAAWETRLTSLLSAGHWGAHLDGFLSACSNDSNDDSTLMVAIQNDSDDEDVAGLLASIEAGRSFYNLPGRVVRRIIQDEIRKMLQAGRPDEVQGLLDYCKEQGRAFDYDFLTGIIGSITDRNLWWRVNELIRSANRGK